jgi:hypothetical protein
VHSTHKNANSICYSPAVSSSSAALSPADLCCPRSNTSCSGLENCVLHAVLCCAVLCRFREDVACRQRMQGIADVIAAAGHPTFVCLQVGCLGCVTVGTTCLAPHLLSGMTPVSTPQGPPAVAQDIPGRSSSAQTGCCACIIVLYLLSVPTHLTNLFNLPVTCPPYSADRRSHPTS